jgi:hypothetical protein
MNKTRMSEIPSPSSCWSLDTKEEKIFPFSHDGGGLTGNRIQSMFGYISLFYFKQYFSFLVWPFLPTHFRCRVLLFKKYPNLLFGEHVLSSYRWTTNCTICLWRTFTSRLVPSFAPGRATSFLFKPHLRTSPQHDGALPSLNQQVTGLFIWHYENSAIGRADTHALPPTLSDYKLL